MTVLTSRDATGSDWGVTATAFCGVSEEPPLVLVCLAAAAGSTLAFAESERFAVSVLRPEHEDLAERFATGRPDKFILGGFERAQSGLSVVCDALAVLECRTAEVRPAGDHTVVLGEVQRAQGGKGPALAYLHRDLKRLDG